MNILDRIWPFSKSQESESFLPPPPPRKKYIPNFETSSSVISSPWIGIPVRTFNGEKTPGELGYPIYLVPDARAIALRSYEANISSDVIKMVTGKFFRWVIGSGLKCQANPNQVILEFLGYNADLTVIKEYLDAKFNLCATMKQSDYSGVSNLHTKASEAYKTAFLSGDCVVIYRVKNGFVNAQVVDGLNIQSPSPTDEFYAKAVQKGNRIVYGVELDKHNSHVAYYVKTQEANGSVKLERVPCRINGRVFAKMIYGEKARPSDVRGVSCIAAIIEKVTKLDRYTEASVGSAEERAKIVFSIKHNQYSTGENPMMDMIKKKHGNIEEPDPYLLGETLSKTIQSTTQKQTFNMPVGSELDSLDSDAEFNYDKFFNAIFDQVCSSMDVPPEVALQKYSSNYSASRAAINGWGYIINTERQEIADDFYKPFYDLWLELEVLSDNSLLRPFLKAYVEGDVFAVTAFSQCKFLGVNMPHIDPLKEVKAFREMLGGENADVPLISLDQAAESLGAGDWLENYKRYLKEREKIKPIEDDTNKDNLE